MILVLGGTGILGSSLVKTLLEEDNCIRILYRSEKKKQYLIDFLNTKGISPKLIEKIEWFIGDVLDMYSLEKAFEGSKEVYHCANMVSFDERDRAEMFRINVQGTQNILQVALESSIEKFCFVSSIATIDKGEEEEINENSYWNFSLNHTSYEESKYLAEMEVWRAMEEGLNAVIVNPGVILSGFDFSGSSGELFKIYNQKYTFYTSGSTSLIDVQDVADRMIFLMKGNYFFQRYILVAETWSYQALSFLLTEQFQQPHPFFVSNSKIQLSKKLLQFFRPLIPALKQYSSAFLEILTLSHTISNQKIKEIYPQPFRPIQDSLQEYSQIYISTQ